MTERDNIRKTKNNSGQYFLSAPPRLDTISCPPFPAWTRFLVRPSPPGHDFLSALPRLDNIFCPLSSHGHDFLSAAAG
jgi:hypothetical protein